jgi:hypothetical protein
VVDDTPNRRRFLENPAPRPRRDHTTATAGVYYVHGGGMIFGNRFTDLGRLAGRADGFDVVHQVL